MWAGAIHKRNKSIVCNTIFTSHKVSLLQNCTPILLLSKFNTNLKFRASTAITWSCMKLRLFHNSELLWHKVIKTRRCIQQWYSSWNLFVYIFTLSVCKICKLPSKKTKKNKRKKFKLSVYSCSITPPSPFPAVCTFMLLNWPPPP